MAQVHPTARHQASQDPKGLCTLYATEDYVEVAMGENDTSTVQHSGIWKIG
jgi:expansin (peptidoglycan-binding protein)